MRAPFRKQTKLNGFKWLRYEVGDFQAKDDEEYHKWSSGSAEDGERFSPIISGNKVVSGNEGKQISQNHAVGGTSGNSKIAIQAVGDSNVNYGKRRSYHSGK